MKRFAYSFLLARIQIFLNKDLWAPQSLIQNKLKLSFFSFIFMARNMRGKIRIIWKRPLVLFMVSLSPLFSRVWSFLLFLYNNYFHPKVFLSPVALRNEAFLKTQKTDCSGQHSQLSTSFPYDYFGDEFENLSWLFLECMVSYCLYIVILFLYLKINLA